MMKRWARGAGRLLLFCAMALLLSGVAMGEKLPITSYDRLAQPGVTIAVGLDTPQEPQIKRDYPEAKVVYYSDMFTAYTEVANGRIDACINGRKEMELAIQNGVKGVRLLDENYAANHIAVGISPVSSIPDLRGKLNAFIAELKSDGTLDDMYERWVIRDDETMPEIPEAEDPALTLCVGTTGSVMPFSYYIGTELAGYDIELAQRFACWLGAKLELKVYDYGGIVAAAEAGSIDCIMANLYYTDEKADSIPFSDVLFDVEITAMVRDDGQAAQGVPAAGKTTMDQLNGKCIAVPTGAIFDALVLQRLPDAKIVYLNTTADFIASLESGKIDAFVLDEPAVRQMMRENGSIEMLDEFLDTFDFGFALAKSEKGEALKAEMDAWMTAMRESGELEKLLEKWIDGPEEGKTVPDFAAFPAPNGKLTLATGGDYAPLDYFRGTDIVGLEIDLAAQFCEARGYGLEVEIMSFDGILASVQSGKVDLGVGGISITEERKENMNFSVPYYTGGAVMTVLASPLETSVQSEGDGRSASVDALDGKRIGVQTGTIHDGLVAERLPNAKIDYFNGAADMSAALKSGKIDAFACPGSVALFMRSEDKSLTWPDEHLLNGNIALAFAKTEAGWALNERFSEYIRALRADGGLDALVDKWFTSDESGKTIVNYAALPDTNGTLRMATEGTAFPFSYVREDGIVGFEIDLVAGFCEENGYRLQVEQMNFDGVLASVQTGKCDLAGNCLAVTEERKESIDFSEPYFAESVVLVTLNESAEAAPTFLDSIRDSFNKTFIREGRWKLFAEGVGTTMLITLLSILFGTALGFVVFMLCRNGNPLTNGVTRFCTWLVQGMPMVVLLMILYYVVFGKLAIGGIPVAVIGFTLTFGAGVFGLLKMGVGAVDPGQYEAACALGHSNRHTFYRIILPQALPYVMPAYRGETVGLIKSTAIVGYIAVQDLTKMGDIVRSRTYEAFFPLIAITIIYFVLEGLIGFAVSRIGLNFDPKRRKPGDILKGIHTEKQE